MPLTGSEQNRNKLIWGEIQSWPSLWMSDLILHFHWRKSQPNGNLLLKLGIFPVEIVVLWKGETTNGLSIIYWLSSSYPMEVQPTWKCKQLTIPAWKECGEREHSTSRKSSCWKASTQPTLIQFTAWEASQSDYNHHPWAQLMLESGTHAAHPRFWASLEKKGT